MEESKQPLDFGVPINDSVLIIVSEIKPQNI